MRPLARRFWVAFVKALRDSTDVVDTVHVEVEVELAEARRALTGLGDDIENVHARLRRLIDECRDEGMTLEELVKSRDPRDFN